MRAMPSPTDRTWPTSATSASVPKLAICSLRMAEISAARISICLNSSHGKLQPLKLAAQRAVDHARPDFDDETADDRGIDPDIDGNLGAYGPFQLIIEGGDLRLAHFLRRRDLGADFAAPFGQEVQITRDHARQGEKPAVARDQPDEVPGQGRDFGTLQQRLHGRSLRVAAQYRRADQPLQIGAAVDHGAERAQI